VFDHSADFEIIVSSAIEAEYVDVINRPELVAKYRAVHGRDLATIRRIISNATVVEPTSEPHVCRDPGADKFLAAASAGSARFIVSEDRDLLDLGNSEGIPIMNAEAILRLYPRPRNARK
jgi:putative PIN family toxin of toxin-antitoxin system